MASAQKTDQEIEIRGKFDSGEELESFLKKIKKRAVLKEHRRRFSVIFTEGNKKGLDLQVRSLNNSPEIILKVGKHSGTSRKELKIPICANSFETAVNLFFEIGFKNGVVAEAEDWLWEIEKSWELKVTSCDGKIFCWEIEALSKGLSLEFLYQAAQRLQLKPMSEEETIEYWRWMKECVNKKFDILLLKDWYRKYCHYFLPCSR
jgi:hypothetical protein